MARQRSHGVPCKRPSTEASIAGETLHALLGRHHLPHQRIRIRAGKFEAGARMRTPRRPI